MRPFSWLAGLFLVLAAGIVQAASIEETRRMAAAGAVDLALQTIDRVQPAADRQPGRWAEWERLRLELLADKGDWPALLARTRNLPEGAPAALRRQAAELRARALLESGQPAQARRVWAELIWNTEPKQLEHKALRRWRFGILKALMAEPDPAPALAAWRRFQQDYPELTDDELEQRVRFALRAGQPDEALEQLKDRRGEALEPWWLLARLRSGKTPPADIMKAAEAAAGKAESTAVQGRLWLIAAEAAARAGRGRNRVRDLEQALKRLPVARDALLRVRADDLWDSYLDYGRWLGNRARLLQGDDAAWLALAEQEKDPLKRRALHALVAIEGSVEAVRAQGHERLLRDLGADDGLLLENLYLHSANFPGIDYIPQVVRLRLAERALEQGRHDQASELMQGIEAPPEGMDPFDWGLRLARIHILGGREDRGIDGLYRVLGSRARLGRDEADRFLQAVFDLQTLKRDEDALKLLGALLPRLEDRGQVREVYYWMADSWKALGEYDRAATFYLRSALLPDGVGLDPWGQTARFQAAEMLARAGLVEDARRLYEQLLRITHDRKRRIVLRQRLQQLHLQE
ncbi:MAG: hypothetical protein D6717_11875 [Gammaproteobacteria bacterium]|nr:MAG: hypothetical protein D6717_11875 [Gammaproteobacteria bacterium]